MSLKAFSSIISITIGPYRFEISKYDKERTEQFREMFDDEEEESETDE